MDFCIGNKHFYCKDRKDLTRCFWTMLCFENRSKQRTVRKLYWNILALFTFTFRPAFTHYPLPARALSLAAEEEKH